ncbi:hypothetical protein [Aeromonas caviae]|uniref:hypothetical protein n=1 Tax=Aeromonas caviae TaxID=648 RepID=UPI00101B189A|nr:hypothetical protein [Aeromonas caviae]BBG91784.1 hypothetical protein ACGSH8M1_p30130 [Aeromonas caviae]
MSDGLNRLFSIKSGSILDGDYCATFHAPELPSVGMDSFLWPQKAERKYNIRIRREDLSLLDALATHHNITRSALINRLLYSVLLNRLNSIKDLDARALIAKTADQLVNDDGLTSPWLLDAVGKEWRYITKNILDFNSVREHHDEPDVEYNSDTFRYFVNKLQGMNK